MPDDAHLLQIEELPDGTRQCILSALRGESVGLGYFGAVMDTGRKAAKALAREAALLPQEELLEAKKGQAELTIGIPAETSLQEKRVALVPEAVALLAAHGHQVLVETQAGANAQFSDNDYSEAGARIVYDKPGLPGRHCTQGGAAL